MAFERPFKIEIKKDDKKISFGPRRPNEVGRDILAIKVALGLVEPAPDTDSGIALGEALSEDQKSSVSLDSQSWFDCGSGLGMDIRQASTYDSRLRNALTNYQIQNQFLIISYLLEKYGLKDFIGQVARSVEFGVLGSNIPKKYNQSLIKMIESASILFESELGLLGEATIAILHGWVPHSSYTNRGYAHVGIPAYSTITDIIHTALAREIDVFGSFAQKYSDMVDQGLCTENGFLYNDESKLNKYLEYASSGTDWTSQARDFQFASLEFIYKSPNSTSSILYNASLKILEFVEETRKANDYGDASMSSQERIENLKRMYFPDPFTDPPPFEIDTDRIGFFMETDFELKPDKLPNELTSTISSLEQQALEKVFESYRKPKMWYLNHSAELINNTENNEIEKIQVEFFGGAEKPSPAHNGFYPFVNEHRRNYNTDEIFEKYKEYSEFKRRIDFNAKHKADAMRRASSSS